MAMLKRLYFTALRRLIRKMAFPIGQALGFHVTLNHYYEPVPDTRRLSDNLWRRPSELRGLEMNESEQLRLLSLFASNYKSEYDAFPTSEAQASSPYEYHRQRQSFSAVDAEILYCMVRHFNPQRILEVGSGASSLLVAQALRKNREQDKNCQCEYVAIDPYPGKAIRAGFPGLSALWPKAVQDIPLAEFQKLRGGDILFIDSSHVLKIGSDVQYEFLEILPRLHPGALVHLHDIFLPEEYPKHWVLKEKRFWTEQYLLQAFLAFNNAFEVLWAGNFMRLKHSRELEAAFGSYDADTSRPGSFWMRRAK